MSLSAKNHWLDEKGRVYIIFTISNVMGSLNCAEHKEVKSMSNLEFKAKLIGRKRQFYEDYFREELEIDFLKQQHVGDRETLDGIIDLMVDVCCSKRKVIRIAVDDKPVDVVKSRFMKLNSTHMDYVLHCLSANSTKVRNIKQYLLATLYNAPATISPYYQSWVNNDTAGGRL